MMQQDESDAPSKETQIDPLRARLQRALSFHQAGQFAQAAVLYGEILTADPDHFDALQLSGLIAYEFRNLEEAELFFLKALCIRADIASVYSNYGLVLHGLNRHADAIVTYDMALARDPTLCVTYMNRGVALANLKVFADAVASYDKAITIAPDYAEAFSNRGNARRDMQRLEQALQDFDMAIALKPDYADAYNNRGNVLCDMKEFAAAIRSYDIAIVLTPEDGNPYGNRGNVERRLLRFSAANASFDQSMAIRPDYASDYINRGNVLYDMKSFHDAVRSYDKGIMIEPRSVEGHAYRGAALHELKRFDEAAANFEMAIAIKPDYAEAYNKQGNLLRTIQQFSAALACFDRAIWIKPEDAEALNNRSNALRDLHRFDEALSSCDAAIAIKPDYAEAFSNRAFTLYDQERLDEALWSCDQAISIKPDLVEAWLNRAKVLQDLKRFDEAVTTLNKAACIDATNAEIYHNLSHLLLLLGHFEDGLAFYEWRKKSAEPKGSRSFSKPLWTGREDLFQKTILVHWEQGLGDTIQFCRYIRLLSERGAKVLFAPQKPLRRLLRALDGLCEIVDEDDPSLAFDFHCPLLSLPLAFETLVSDIPARETYLRAEVARVAKWKVIIGDRGLRIGVCWQGSTGKIDAGRSFSLGQFQALSQIPGLRLISLHKGAGEAQLAGIPQGMSVETLGPDFDSGPDAFLDTAAVMMCCDLVVTSDTAVAHLAGALGVKTWVAVKHVPDWRWFLDRSDSPWYPSMRLFRQHSHGDWNGVFRDIGAALRGDEGRVTPDAASLPCAFSK